jgi:hypothetical protein
MYTNDAGLHEWFFLFNYTGSGWASSTVLMSWRKNKKTLDLHRKEHIMADAKHIVFSHRIYRFSLTHWITQTHVEMASLSSNKSPRPTRA